jgi:trans-aconitate 2-methyltransferase
MPWDPDRYHQFQKERSAPFDDLLALVHVRPGLQVIDLGCGTGELTRRLADALPQSRVLGIDASTEMLKKAMPWTRPGLQFEQSRIEEVAGLNTGGAGWDLIFSNAAVQWVDGHTWLIPYLYSLVKPGGQMVIQMPSNHTHIAHTSIIETAQEQPFLSALNGWVRKSPVLAVEAYASLLFECGGRDLTVFEKVYPHVLADADALADWTSGTALVPYFERLSADLKHAFMARYRAKLRQVWPDGPVFYPFRRILFSAVHGEPAA